MSTIGVFPSIRHTKQTLLGVLQFEILVLKFFSIYRFSTSPISIGEVTTLDHEVRDDPVEARTLVAKAFLAGRKNTEVFGRLEWA